MQILKNNKTRKEKNKTITELLYFSERLNTITRSTVMVFILVYFVIQTFAIVNMKEILKFAKTNTTLFHYGLYASMSYTPLILVQIMMKMIVQKYQTVKFKNLKFFLVEAFNSILTYMIFPFEFVIFPLKFVLFGCYILTPEFRESLHSDTYINFALGCIAASDILFSILLVQIKTSFMRSFCPKSGYLCKIEGIFEEIFFIGMCIVVGLKIFGDSNVLDERMHWLIFTSQAGVLLVLTVIYLRELPYLRKTTEKTMGHFLSAFSLFGVVYGACEFEINLSLKIWCFTVPFMAVGVEYYLKNAYCYDFFDKGAKKSKRILKKILVQSTEIKKNQQEQLFDSGVIKNYLMSGKTVNKKFYSLWKKKAEIYRQISNSVYAQENEQEDNLLELDSKVKPSELEIKEKQRKIDVEITMLILKEYTKFNNKSSYCLMVNILWLLENNLVLGDILRYLNDMVLKTNSFKLKFYYYYAKRVIQTKLKDYYFHRNLFMSKYEKKQKTVFKVEEELKEINEMSVATYYAFTYKEGVEEMTQKIEKFVKINQKYLSLLRSQTKSLKELFALSVELFNIHREIELKFDKIHSITRNIECTHLTPYFYYLVRCVNLHRKASKIFKIYKQRMITKKNLIDEKARDLDDVSLFYQSLIFLIDSQKKSFGIITDVYGDSRHLKVTPADLIGKHMDCVVMKSQREAHKDSIENFVYEPISSLIGATTYSFVKLPEKNFILRASIIKKIVPYEETNFKYCVGIKYLKRENSVYLLLDGDNEIDSFSYSTRYLFRNPEEYIYEGYQLKDLCPEIYDKVFYARKDSSVPEEREWSESGKKKGNGSSKEATDLGEPVKNSQEAKSKSYFHLDESMEESEDDTIQAKFSFVNSSSGRVLMKYFRVKIIEKEFKYGNYRYKLLNLTVDDEAQKKAGLRKMKTKVKITVRQEDQEILDSALPPLSSNRIEDSRRETKLNKIRSEEHSFKFMAGKKSSRQASQSNNQNGSTFRNSEIRKPGVTINGEEDSSRLDSEHRKINSNSNSFLKDPRSHRQSSNIHGDRSLDNVMEEQDEQLESNAGFKSDDGTERMLGLEIRKQARGSDGEGNSTVNSQYSRYVDDYDYEDSEDAGEMKYGSSMDDNEFDEDNSFSDFELKKKLMEGTGSVFSTANLQAHKKFFAFEDAVNKTAGLWETVSIIVLYFLSLGATIFFVVFIQVTLKTKNLEFEYGNDMFTSFVQYGFKVQNFYSKVLTTVAMNSQVYSLDRYAKYNFTDVSVPDGVTDSDRTDYSNLNYSLSDLNSYQTFQMETARRDILDHIKTIYGDIGNFEKEKQKFFDQKLAYNDHEVNGTVKPASMGIYQGYILLATTKMVEVSTLPLTEVTKESLDRDVLYLFDNTLNSLPIHSDPFSEFLYVSMNNTYEEFMTFVLMALFVIISLVIVLLIVTLFCIYKIKRMFWDIYYSYTNINEGEFEARFKELSTVDTLLSRFKTSGYFYDFMGEQDIGRTKPDTKKKTKKYQDTMYCFRLLFSLAFIGLFYVIQITFSSGMMLIFRTNVDRALWITSKQRLAQNVLNDQLIFYNSMKQKMILGDNTKAYNESINAFLPKWREQIKQNSDQIFQLFEDNSDESYSKLKDFLVQNSNSSLCSYTSSLLKRKELCHLLDNKIPLRGIVQAYFRVTQYLDEALNHIIQNSENTFDLANDPEFIELEYTFENVYYPAFIFLEDQIHQFFKIYVVEQVSDAVDLIVSLMVGFIAVSFFFTIFSFKNIIMQVNRVAFTFQLLSMDTVINNTGVKFRFLKVYRLNQKHF